MNVCTPSHFGCVRYDICGQGGASTGRVPSPTHVFWFYVFPEVFYFLQRFIGEPNPSIRVPALATIQIAVQRDQMITR